MTEREPIKVYELAKELGIDSLSLVDQLRSLEIQVKNHMSELSDSDVERARSVLKTGSKTGKEASSSKSAASKTPIKRVASPKVAASAKTAVAKAPGKAPATKTAATKAVAAKKADAAIDPAAATPAKAPIRKRNASGAAEVLPANVAAQPAAADAGSSSSTVIRRRVLADGATQQTVTSTVSTSMTAAEAAAYAAETAVPLQEPTDFVTDEVTEEVQAAAPVVFAEPNDGTVATLRTEIKSDGQKSTTSIIRRTEVTTLTTSSATMGDRKGGLRIIEQPTLPKPGGLRMITSAPKAGAARAAGPTFDNDLNGKAVLKTDRETPKFLRVDKENLDRMAEEEARKRGPRGGETIIKPEDIKFGDYRKKEMIFIPKKKKAPVGKEIRRTEITTAAAHKRVIEMNETIKVSELAAQLHVKASEVIKKLMGLGQMATMNQALDMDTATLIATEYQYEVKNVAFKEEEVLGAGEDAPETLISRPPVVTIMGHVDHGKTTLLDSIREANVASGEAGGITQHIGAYTITKDGKMITFIDTPGHEAFTTMRARGANVTDIVILVVSADDGVMPQTREALSHAKAAGVPIIVAVNKIDKPGANPEKIKQSLADLDLLAEDWGGETIYVPVSALKKTNIDKLLESILLVAEVQDLKANPNTAATGVILESRLEKGRGPVASVLVNRGTLKLGDMLVSGTVWGRVKALTNHLGETVKEVMPGMAAEVLGLDAIPQAGDKFDCVGDERAATSLVDHRREQIRVASQKTSKATLEEMFAKIQTGDMKELRIILKADVYGSAEAVRDSLIKQSTDKVKVKVMLSAAGGITESDVMLANASDAIIIGFNVRPETKARAIAESEQVEIKCYSIIYELLDDMKLAMAGLLDKKKVETYLGRAEVRQTFSIPKAGTIAGCSVVDGKIIRNASVRLLRDSRVIYDGKLSSLKRFKDDAKEVAQGYECGMGIDGYNDLKVGDLIEAYQIDMIAQEL